MQLNDQDSTSESNEYVNSLTALSGLIPKHRLSRKQDLDNDLLIDVVNDSDHQMKIELELKKKKELLLGDHEGEEEEYDNLSIQSIEMCEGSKYIKEQLDLRMRRGIGVSGINKKALEKAKFETKATEISSNELAQLNLQMEKFKTNLEQFAFKYKDEIKKDSNFRRQFQDMCATIGVDPLASSKGFWSDILGVGDFYYELAVQIIEICTSMEERTGGLIYLDQVTDKIRRTRSKFGNEVNEDDCKRAIKKLHIFGAAFTLVSMSNGRYMIQSLPEGMNVDHSEVLNIAEKNCGIVSYALALTELKWDPVRIENILISMVKEGIVWIDVNKNQQKSYYFPSLFMELK
jgi:ESCRT-II complex subunit VPS22